MITTDEAMQLLSTVELETNSDLVILKNKTSIAIKKIETEYNIKLQLKSLIDYAKTAGLKYYDIDLDIQCASKYNKFGTIDEVVATNAIFELKFRKTKKGSVKCVFNNTMNQDDFVKFIAENF